MDIDSPTALFLARFHAFKNGDRDFIWHSHSRDNPFYREHPDPEDFRADYGALLVKGVALREIREASDPDLFETARALIPVADEAAEERALLLYALVYKTGNHKEYHHELGLFLRQDGRWGFQASISTPTRRYRPGTPLSAATFGNLLIKNRQPR